MVRIRHCEARRTQTRCAAIVGVFAVALVAVACGGDSGSGAGTVEAQSVSAGNSQDESVAFTGTSEVIQTMGAVETVLRSGGSPAPRTRNSTEPSRGPSEYRTASPDSDEAVALDPDREARARDRAARLATEPTPNSAGQVAVDSDAYALSQQ